MCNLYSMIRNREAILRLFQVADNRAAAVTPLGAILPRHRALVVRHAGALCGCYRRLVLI